jgi:hypothetical protein
MWLPTILTNSPACNLCARGKVSKTLPFGHPQPYPYGRGRGLITRSELFDSFRRLTYILKLRYPGALLMLLTRQSHASISNKIPRLMERVDAQWRDI